MHNTNQKKQFSAGHYIFKAGDKGAHAFVLLKGQVDLLASHASGEPQVISRVEENSIFGEMALFNQAVRVVSAKAATDIECLVVDRTFLESQLKESPVFVRGLVRVMTKSLKAQIEKT